MAVLKRLPLLTALLADIKSKSGTGDDLSSEAGPGNYKDIETVTLEALTNAKLPPGTPVPNANSMRRGWDITMKQSGDPPKMPQFNRPLLSTGLLVVS